ncbi:tetratricopeptide repeat protein [bacterium]|nr:tetratricopeptide repeat protein [candidate division CSSED10-310 bacterium]
MKRATKILLMAGVVLCLLQPCVLQAQYPAEFAEIEQFFTLFHATIENRDLDRIIQHYDRSSPEKTDAIVNLYSSYFATFDTISCQFRLSALYPAEIGFEAVVFQQIEFRSPHHNFLTSHWKTFFIISKPDGWKIKSEQIRDYIIPLNTDLSIYLDTKNRLLTGTATLTVSVTRSGENTVIMQLNPGLKVIGIVDANGEKRSFRQRGSLVTVDFGPLFNKGDQIELMVRYRGVFVNENLERGYSQLHIGDSISFASWITNWYPRINGKNTKSTGKITFDVPRRLNVVCQGKLTGYTTYNQRAVVTHTIATPHDFSFAASEYIHSIRDVDGISVGVYLLNNDSERMNFYLDRVSSIIGYLKNLYGFYPYDTYYIVEIPSEIGGSLGGSSEQGMTFFPEKTLKSGYFNFPLICHEMGHSWWGNTVHSRESNIIDEGLAQVTALLCIEHFLGTETMREFLKSGFPDFPESAFFYFLLQADREGRDISIACNRIDKWMELHMLAETKGAFAYIMLRDLIGNDHFISGLQNIIRTHANHDVSLADLQREWEMLSGQDLDWFFDQWFYQSGAPEFLLTYRSNRSSDGFYLTQCQIRQSRDVYRVRADILVQGEEEQDHLSFWITEKEMSFQFETPFEPCNVIFDPEYKILRWTDYFKHIETLGDALLLQHLGKDEEALELYQDFLNEHPDNWLGHFYIANTYLIQQDFEKAREHYEILEESIGENPGFKLHMTQAYLRLGKSCEALNLPYDALNAYNKVLSMDNIAGSHEMAQLYIAILEKKLDPNAIEKKIPNLAALWRRIWYFGF